MKAFLLLFSCILISCNKDPYKDPDELELPPITMEGKNTFGCKVNGEIWLPFVENPSLFNKALDDIVEPPSIGIQATLRKDKDKIFTRMNLKCNAVDTGTYHIPPLFYGNVFNNINLDFTCSGYKVDTINSLIRILKLDYNQRIVAGTFSYKDVINECGDTLQITEGRFDIRY